MLAAAVGGDGAEVSGASPGRVSTWDESFAQLAVSLASTKGRKGGVLAAPIIVAVCRGHTTTDDGDAAVTSESLSGE